MLIDGIVSIAGRLSLRTIEVGNEKGTTRALEGPKADGDADEKPDEDYQERDKVLENLLEHPYVESEFVH